MLAATNATEIKVAFKPIPGTSQEIALDSRANETLYQGTRGPGKTAIQLARFARHVGKGYGAYWRGIIFGREYNSLNDLIAQSKRIFGDIFGDKARFYESQGAYMWEWDTGEVLMFRAIKKPQEYFDKYHGQEFPYIGFNELVQWPTSEIYDLLRSCNRSSWTQEKNSPRDKNGNYLLPPIPLDMFSTTNSEGVGHTWVKAAWIDVIEIGRVFRKHTTIISPKDGKERVITRTQICIFGSYIENIYLDDAYIANLNEACRTNENRARSWLKGDWDIVSGGAFEDRWIRSKHVIPMFAIPDNWFVNRAFDWGSLHPFSVGWFAEANGETVKFPDGRKFTPYPGSIIQVAEWYGTNAIGSNKGIKMGSKSVAKGILEREKQLTDFGLIRSRIFAGPADNSIKDVKDDDTETIADLMQKEGVSWTDSDKSKGARTVGLELMRQRMENAVTGEGAALYFMENCRSSIATIPILPYDEDKQAVGIADVDTTAEDHPYDMVRYRILSGGRTMTKPIKVSFPI